MNLLKIELFDESFPNYIFLREVKVPFMKKWYIL